MWTSDLTIMMLEGIRDTLLMTLMSTLFGYLFGLPMGIALAVTDKTGIRPNAVVYKVLDVIVNIVRSVPFLILLILVMPLTRAIVGKTTGSVATIVPLTLAAAPFIGRMIESSLKEVDRGVIEAAESMGASPFQIMFKVLLPEAKPSLLIGAAISVTTILGYSAMAGIVGGGGLGAIAMNYGYYRYQEDIMFITVILLVVIVQIMQEVGMKIATASDKRL